MEALYISCDYILPANSSRVMWVSPIDFELLGAEELVASLLIEVK